MCTWLTSPNRASTSNNSLRAARSSLLPKPSVPSARMRRGIQRSIESAVRGLRERFPGAHLTYIVEPAAAPIVAGNHVLVGTGNDIDAPGFLQSFDPETGEMEWKFYSTPPPGTAGSISGGATGGRRARSPALDGVWRCRRGDAARPASRAGR